MINKIYCSYALFVFTVFISSCSHSHISESKPTTPSIESLTIEDFEHGYFYGSDVIKNSNPAKLAGTWLVVGAYCRTAEGKSGRNFDSKGFVDRLASQDNYDVEKDGVSCPVPFYKVSIVSGKNASRFEAHYFDSDGKEDRSNGTSINSIPAQFPKMLEGGRRFDDSNIQTAILKRNECEIIIKMNELSFASARKQHCEL